RESIRHATESTGIIQRRTRGQVPRPRNQGKMPFLPSHSRARDPFYLPTIFSQDPETNREMASIRIVHLTGNIQDSTKVICMPALACVSSIPFASRPSFPQFLVPARMPVLKDAHDNCRTRRCLFQLNCDSYDL